MLGDAREVVNFGNEATPSNAGASKFRSIGTTSRLTGPFFSCETGVTDGATSCGGTADLPQAGHSMSKRLPARNMLFRVLEPIFESEPILCVCRVLALRQIFQFAYIERVHRMDFPNRNSVGARSGDC
jgi:hypothetical protein